MCPAFIVVAIASVFALLPPWAALIDFRPNVAYCLFGSTFISTVSWIASIVVWPFGGNIVPLLGSYLTHITLSVAACYYYSDKKALRSAMVLLISSMTTLQVLHLLQLLGILPVSFLMYMVARTVISLCFDVTLTLKLLLTPRPPGDPVIIPDDKNKRE